MTSNETNYPVKPMDANTLERRRDHSQRNPWGNTAEMVGHIDWQAGELERLRGIVAGLECIHSHGNKNWACAKLGTVKMCQVCRAKEAANAD